MTTAQRPRETTTGFAAWAWLATFNRATRTIAQERVIVLDGTTVSLDLLGRDAEPERDTYFVCECKLSLTREVVEQAIRMLPFAHRIWVCVNEPRAKSKLHEYLRGQLVRHGIGLLYVSVYGKARQSIPTVFHAEVDSSLLAHALDSHDGSCDPPAGSAGVRRMDAGRARLACLAEWLRGFDYATWDQIFLVPDFEAFGTPHQLRKLIKANRDIGIGYRGTSITEFFATEGGK